MENSEVKLKVNAELELTPEEIRDQLIHDFDNDLGRFLSVRNSLMYQLQDQVSDIALLYLVLLIEFSLEMGAVPTGDLSSRFIAENRVMIEKASYEFPEFAISLKRAMCARHGLTTNPDKNEDTV